MMWLAATGGPGRVVVFVGRAAELDRLSRWADEVGTTGVGRFVLVVGSAGVGKSSLCAEFARLVPASRFTVAWSRCGVDGTGPPLWPWPEIIEDLTNARGVATPPVPPGDAGDRFRIFRSIVQRLQALCADGPIVVLVDDLHAAAGDAVLLTRFVARSLHRFPMLLIGTCRPADPAGGPVSAERTAMEHQATMLYLRAFGTDDVAEFLRSWGVPDVGPARAAEVLALTGGNPMHLTEVVLDVARGGGVRDEVLSQAVAHRIAGITGVSRRALEAMAILGESGTLAEVAELLGISLDDVRAALGDAVTVAAPEDGRIRFAHELLRGAVLDQLTPLRRKQLHHQAVRIIRGETPDQVLRRALHSVEGASAEPESRAGAAVACREAALTLRAALALEPAAEWAARGAALAAGVSHALEAELLLARAEAVQARGRLADARQVYDEAVVAAERSGNAQLAARAALGLGGVWVEEERDELSRRRMLGLCRRAVVHLGPDDVLLAARLRVRLSAEEAYDGAQIEDVSAAVDQVRAFGDPGATAEALSLYHHAMLIPSSARARLAVADELLDNAAQVPGTIYGLFGLCWRTIDLYLLGERAADRALVDLRSRASAMGSDSIGYIVAVLDVMRTFRRGDLAKAEIAAAEAHQLGVAVGDADALAWYGAHLLGIRWVQGRLGEMEGLVSTVVDSATLRRRDMIYPAMLGYAAALNGRPAAARAAIGTLVADGLDAVPDFSTWTTTMAALVEAAAELRDEGLARQLVDRFEPYATLPVMPSLAVMCLGPGERVMAVGNAAAGRLDVAVEWFNAALAANGRIGSRPFDALIHGQLADTLRRRGARGDARVAGDHYALAVDLGRETGLTGRLADWERHAAETRRQAPPLVAPVAGLLERRADSWRLEIEDRAAVLEPLVGLRYIAELLSRPDTDISARRLSAAVSGGAPPDSAAGGDSLLDERALREYRHRISELDRELDVADLTGDAVRAHRAAHERDVLVDALRRDTGLGGRSRRQPDEAERSRMRVSKAVRRAVAHVVSADPVLGHVLLTGIRTGYTCRYVTDPGRPIVWTVRWTGSGRN